MAYNWRGALVYPLSGPGRERPVIGMWVLCLVGTVVPLVPVVPALGLLVPTLTTVSAVGYLLRVLVASERGDPAPRLLSKPLALVRNGVGALVVAGVYLAIPVLLLVVTVHGALVTDRVPDADSFSTLAIYAGSTTVLVLSLAGAYTVPIGLATYGERRSVRSAFSRRELRTVGTHAAYFAGWTATMGLFAFVLAIAVGVGSAHVGGPVVATGLLAYASVVTAHVLGRAIARAR